MKARIKRHEPTPNPLPLGGGFGDQPSPLPPPSGRGRWRGFTIIEVIVIIVIIGVIAAVVAPRLISRIGQSKSAMAKSNAAALASAMNTYLADCGTPEAGATIDILMERPSDVAEDKWKGPYVQNKDMLNDPWGKKYELLVPGKKNVDFDVMSYGLDGQPGGEGENSDTIAP